MSFLYLKHFDLERSPFQITPDIDFFFSGSQRGGILTALLHVACHEEGIVTAVAEVGSGKTLLARLMISRLPADISSVYLANPCFSRDEIISAISRDLGLSNQPASTEENLAQLHQELLRRHAQGLRVLLVIDEAHAMPPESLEEVRLLSNLETDRHKLVNIMLFGQPELDTLLADRRLRQLRDRVIHRFELPPLPHDEATAYIDHRLRIAGWRGGRLFTPAAMALLVKASQGRARRINLLADKSLLAAYAEGVKQVEKRHVKSACGELHADPATSSWSGLSGLRSVLTSFALAVPMAIVAVWALGWYRTNAPLPPESVAVKSARIAETALVPAADKAPAPVPVVEAAPVAVSASAEPAPLPARASAHESGATGKLDSRQVGAVVQRTEELLSDRKLHGFTLQLASLSSMDRLPGYVSTIAEYVEPSKIYAHSRNYNGKHVVAVYLGQYPTEQEARDVLRKLPEPLSANQPIIRTWTRIRQEPKP
ncbi:MAG: AAA family ATPase [Sulfuritalea sp.]|nr:AAA family ATPase [Sulfuritalea sp.]MDP1984593.1 AAA family ATPase [Sulfuritalea sp.]